MSIINSKEVSLPYLIEESNLIVEVEFVKHYKENIAIAAKEPEGPPSKPIPPFVKKGYIFKVTGVLKNSGNIKVPETIQVPVENWRRSLSQHKERYANGVSKSFTVMEYSTEVDKIETASLLFLHHFQNNYELTTGGAFENGLAREKINMLLRSA